MNPDLIEMAIKIAQGEVEGSEVPSSLSTEEPAAVETTLSGPEENRAPPFSNLLQVAPEHAATVQDFQHRTITKESRTPDELAEMILSDLKQVPGCPANGVNITVYGLSPWNSWLSFGVAAGPIRNKAELQEFCSILTDRLRVRYDVRF